MPAGCDGKWSEDSTRNARFRYSFFVKLGKLQLVRDAALHPRLAAFNTAAKCSAAFAILAALLLSALVAAMPLLLKRVPPSSR